VAPALPDEDQAVLIAAAWLHDVGYAGRLAHTGFHPLDGGRWLRGQGFDERITCLVANHSCAIIEAEERGLAAELASEFPAEESVTADALLYCDMTTGPDGQDFEVAQRLAEIDKHYGEGHVVTRFIRRAAPLIISAVDRTEQRLEAAGLGQPM